MKETGLMATDCPMERLEDLLHSLLAPTHGLDENAGGKIHTPDAPLLCLAGEGRRWLAPEVSPSLLLPGRALLTADELKSPPGSGTPGLEVSRSGEGTETAASKPKNVFYLEVVLWIFPNPTSVE